MSLISRYLTFQIGDRILVSCHGACCFKTQTCTFSPTLATQTSGKLRVTFDVSFAHLPCEFVSVDYLDMFGTHNFNLHNNIKRKSIEDNDDTKDRKTARCDYRIVQHGKTELILTLGSFCAVVSIVLESALQTVVHTHF